MEEIKWLDFKRSGIIQIIIIESQKISAIVDQKKYPDYCHYIQQLVWYLSSVIRYYDWYDCFIQKVNIEIVKVIN